MAKICGRYVLVFCLLLLTVATSIAGPANPDPVDITQPDGSKITIKMHGDEFQNWTELEDTGHTIIRNHSTGFWEYAERSYDGTLRGSGVKIRPKGQNAPANIPKGLKPPRNKDLEQQMNQMLQDIYQQRLSSAGEGGLPNGSLAAAGDWVPTPVSGSRKMLVILVSFANKAIDTTPTSWNSTVFNTAAKSVAKYYKDNSFNTLNITPVTHTQAGNPVGVVSVTLATNHPWFIGNTTSISFADDQAWGNSALVKATPFVDFDSLDTNGDGILDPSEVVIYFVVAGYEASGSALTPAVWAHAWRRSGTGLTAGTKNVQRWSQSGEFFNTTTRMTMGVIAHELGHQMGGLPDLYDTSSPTQNSALGEFSLMAGGSWGGDYVGGVYETGGTTPTALDAWSRESLGWTTPVTPTAGTTVNLPHALSSSTAALKLILPATSTTEYFLAENRYPIGWDLGLKRRLGAAWTGGMLLTHIDITAGTQGNNDINKYSTTIIAPGHQGVVPVQASTASCDMLVGTACRGHATTLFYQGNNNIWGLATSPNSNYYSGASTTFSLSNISVPSSTMTATFNFNGTVNGACGNSNKQVFTIAPTTNLCLAGAASVVSGSGPWTWNCSGLNGGEVASCSTGTSIASESFGTTPCTLPVGWTVTDNAATTAIWHFDDPKPRTNLTGGTGCFAIADSDYASSVNMDTELRSPFYDFSSYSSVNLDFKTYFKFYNVEVSDVDVSDDGGSTWSNVWKKSGANYFGTESIDISTLAAGKSNVKIRFHYYNAYYDYYWQIDDVVLSGVLASKAKIGSIGYTSLTAAYTAAVSNDVIRVLGGEMPDIGLSINDTLAHGKTVYIMGGYNVAYSDRSALPTTYLKGPLYISSGILYADGLTIR